MDRELFPVGEWVQHFKKETVNNISEKNQWKYVYEIEGYGKDAETENNIVVYKSVFDKKIWVRTVDNFMSEVDHKKYPNIKQKYRFERFESLKF